MSRVEIRGSGTRWAVLVDGRQVDTSTKTYEMACIKARKIERDLQLGDRPCLTCGAPFTAEGRFNRLCPACTDFAAGAMV